MLKYSFSRGSDLTTTPSFPFLLGVSFSNGVRLAAYVSFADSATWLVAIMRNNKRENKKLLILESIY